MVNEELDQLLKNLHLKRVRELLDEELSHATDQDLGYQDFLLRLRRAQWHDRALFVSAQDLVDEMYASLADRSTRKLMKQLSRIDVLCIDEMGYLTIRPEQANIFFKLMEERYTKKPTIITTNLAYEEWSQFLGKRSMVDALLSRLRHRCHTITIDGPSLRDPQS